MDDEVSGELGIERESDINCMRFYRREEYNTGLLIWFHRSDRQTSEGTGGVSGEGDWLVVAARVDKASR